MSVFWRYWLLQIPGWLLLLLALFAAHRWLGLSLAIAAAVFLAWLVKDVVLYPILGKAYALRELPKDKLVGEEATTERPLSPIGYVRLRGELWRAELTRPGDAMVGVGQKVRVVAVEGLLLRVTPLREAD